VAADVAQTTNLPIAANVANLSISTQIKSELPQSSDATTISKPQIIQPTASGRTITSYTTVAGDTVQSVAAANGVSADTVSWANKLTSDAINPNTVLQILPISGITYTAQSGDTVQSLATKYKADPSRIITYNDLDATGAVLQIPAYGDGWTGGAGHVAIVESVNDDGSIYISEMNYAGNFNRVTYRTVSAGQAALYNYIH
jgi:LysM repeat protein